MDGTEFDGKDLEDALAQAADALGRPVADLDYQLVEGGRKGVFGLGARPVRIRISAGAAAALPGTAPDAPVAIEDDRNSPQARALEEIFRHMRFSLRIEEQLRDGMLELTLDGADLPRMTARDGELLHAVEFILNRMGRRGWPDGPPVRVLGRGFRMQRDDRLVSLVEEAIRHVASSGQPRRLHAMNPYERRVVHMTVREHPGLTSISEGDGFMKRVRVEKLSP